MEITQQALDRMNESEHGSVSTLRKAMVASLLRFKCMTGSSFESASDASLQDHDHHTRS